MSLKKHIESRSRYVEGTLIGAEDQSYTTTSTSVNNDAFGNARARTSSQVHAQNKLWLKVKEGGAEKDIAIMVKADIDALPGHKIGVLLRSEGGKEEAVRVRNLTTGNFWRPVEDGFAYKSNGFVQLLAAFGLSLVAAIAYAIPIIGIAGALPALHFFLFRHQFGRGLESPYKVATFLMVPASLVALAIPFIMFMYGAKATLMLMAVVFILVMIGMMNFLSKHNKVAFTLDELLREKSSARA